MANAIFITHNKSSLIVAPRTFHKCQSSNVDNVRISFGSNIKFNGSRVPQQNLLPLRRNMNIIVCASTQPGPPLPVNPSPFPSPSNWKLWVVGTIFTIVMSFSKGKWGPLLLLKEKVETTIEEAERIADVIEEVAERVDKAAEEVVKIIPEGKLRDAVEFVEKVAENVDKIAENAGDTLEKVDDMEDELDSLLKSLPKQQINAVTTTESKDQK
ncbi:hypothetical protein HN51_050890 [Arachis hypogaea]|uniref:Uncharacterized protein n=1 Tax=Arachis hypogaea TaxID=3818 RepID=A0A444Y9J3_ARAHY|nr:uncharacterized protein LOC112766617 isoform X1 [Arachis hypogaea]QHN92691.1 uncharacterized protein DS421_17g586020 [Arachis hypogaea]RYQ98507.1 hypothetical protein Ahy_B07g086235 [Arachis hypogaea]